MPSPAELPGTQIEPVGIEVDDVSVRCETTRDRSCEKADDAITRFRPFPIFAAYGACCAGATRRAMESLTSSRAMRGLLVSDLHYALKQFDWVHAVADRFDLVVIAGDSLDISSVRRASRRRSSSSRSISARHGSAPGWSPAPATTT